MSPTLPSFATLLAVFLGAGLGALLRLLFALCFNTAEAIMPWGTLTANWLGGALVGVTLAALESPHFQLALGAHLPLVRAGITVGFLGGLTTFSTFSAEVIQATIDNRWGSALAIVAAHVLGSLALTAGCYQLCKFD